MTSTFSVLTFFNRRWWWVTLVVIAGMILLGRLGVWQLDRLEERRGENAILEAQLAEDAINLNEEANMSLLAATDNLEFLQVEVTGTYHFPDQVFLIQRTFRGMPGRHLITPLKIHGTDQAILVDRGWTPNNNDGDYVDFPRFAELGSATVQGYLKESEKLPNGLVSPIPETAQEEWFRVEIPAIQAQVPYELLPYYLLALPDDGLPAGSGDLPYREPPTFDLSEGSHLSYAYQWFIFMTMLGGGYIYFVWRQSKEPENLEKTP